MQVCNPSTAGQYFHLLRRQGLDAEKRPLVVMTPKSLLRLPAAGTTAAVLAAGRFEPVLDDPANPDASEVDALLFCSGKIWYDLAEAREREGVRHVALARLEQIYPFPETAFRRLLSRYGRAKVRWVQEEPKNMGAWPFLAQRFSELPLAATCVARPKSGSPATGSLTRHRAEQELLVRLALGAR
jgi:2-oxoglutarate dehydrogenase E1 component